MVYKNEYANSSHEIKDPMCVGSHLRVTVIYHFIMRTTLPQDEVSLKVKTRRFAFSPTRLSFRRPFVIFLCFFRTARISIYIVTSDTGLQQK